MSDLSKLDAGPWAVFENGAGVISDDFKHDVILKISGDFADNSDRAAYAEALAAKLNSSNEAQSMSHKLTDATVHIVTSETDYEGGEPVCAFADKSEAESFAAACDEYQKLLPRGHDFHADFDNFAAIDTDPSLSDAHDRWQAAYDSWVNSHPAGGQHVYSDGYKVREIPMVAACTAPLLARIAELEAELGRSEERYMVMHASATEWAGQRGVMAQWIGEALETLGTIEPTWPDDAQELRALIDSGQRLLGGEADDLLNAEVSR